MNRIRIDAQLALPFPTALLAAVDSPSRAGLTLTPPSAAFAPAPASWYYFGSTRELARGPVGFDLPGGQRFVGFLSHHGQPVVLARHCSHMGADLANGCVRHGRLVCPLHGWEYHAGGRCVHMPAIPRETPPDFARQTAFPTVERGGHVFFFNAPQARFDAPFFADTPPTTLRAARAFDLHDNVPWYFVGANGFDVQHFKNAHDRVLLGEPVVDAPHPFARRIALRLCVAGHSLSDRITRAFAGPELTLTITVWGGTLIFVTAQFQRATSYGLMTVKPVSDHTTHARVIVWVRRSRSSLGRLFFDAVNLELRRSFIQRFLRSDLGRMSGLRYDPTRLVDVDRPFASYMEWLQQLHR